MERVQYQQEQMLPELKDLVDKNLFTQKEIRQIVKQRTAFETALVRRVAKKADFIRYISYEMDLEKLRKLRVKRMDLPKGPATVSDYSFVRRQFHIFERALKRFKSDVALWVQYIQVAKREGARTLVGRVTARALQLHPNNPTFYILAASHELDNLSPSAARALLQRGIRVNPDSVDMWKEYVKMELGFMESLRRRWDVLGIKLESGSTGKGKQKATEEDPSRFLMDERSEEVAAAYENLDIDIPMEGDTDDGAEARRQILEGAIVISVIESAAQALPKIELFEALKTVISDYPCPAGIQGALLDTVYDVLARTLPRDPKGMEMRAYRYLRSSITAVGFVEELQSANEELLRIVGEGSEEALLEVYADFAERWCEKVEDDHLKAYLISSLQGLVQKNARSPSLLAGHIKALMAASGEAPAKVLKTAARYTSQVPQSSRVWLARLGAEKAVGTGTGARDAWGEARKLARGSEEEMVRVWTWGIEEQRRTGMHEASGADLGKRVDAICAQLVELLRESMQASLHGVHEVLLENYVTVLEEANNEPEAGRTSDQGRGWSSWKETVGHMGRQCLTSGPFWERVFERVAKMEAKDAGGKEGVLRAIYEEWRKRDGVGAVVGWAGWLLGEGRGREATEIVTAASASSAEVRARWIAICSSV